MIDDQRNLLYILSEKGAIEAWDLSDNSARRITRLSQNEIANASANVIKTIDSSVFKPVVDICVIAQSDYSPLLLVAVTQSGVRLYFDAYNANIQTMMDVQQPQLRIQNLSLQHVRLPPGYTPNATCGKPRSIHSAFYSGGSMLMVSSPQTDQDILWSLSSEPFLHTKLTPLTETMRCLLAESSTTMHLDGQVWAVAEVKDKSALTLKYPLREAQMAKKVILLTTQGALIVELLRPADLLQQVLQTCHGAHHDAVKSFFEIHAEPESCATSLMLACSESLIGSEVTLWATQAFFRYGGEPYFISQQQLMQQQQQHQLQQQMQPVNEAPRIFMSTPYAQSRPASSIQQSLMQQTQFPGNNSTFQQQQQIDLYNLKYSAKHGGLYLHVARILRPIWNRKCIDSNLASTISIPDCNQILSDLSAVRSFLEANSFSGLMKQTSTVGNILSPYNSFGNPTLPVNGFSGGNQIQQQHQKRDEAFAEEKKSLDALVSFISKFASPPGWSLLCIVDSLFQNTFEKWLGCGRFFASINFTCLSIN